MGREIFGEVFGCWKVGCCWGRGEGGVGVGKE